MSIIPPPPPGDASTVSEPAARRVPEGLTLGAAAVFGAVLLLAVLLFASARSGSQITEAAADDTPTPSVSAQGSGPTGGSGAGSGFGDLPPSAGGSDDDEQSTTTTEPGDDSPAPGGGGGEPPADESEVEPLECPEGVEQVICDAAEFVQRARGRPFKTFPVVEVMEDSQFDRELLADFDEYEADLDTDDVTLTALGLLDPELSLAAVFRDSLEVGVVGFYDPETGQLVVRGRDLSLYAQLVLVHELVHAFDDQWFDLNRSDFPDDEADYGFSAVVEGNASRVERRWRGQLSSADQAILNREESLALSPEDLERLLSLPPVVQDLQFSPYIDGATYVSSLAAAGGEAAVDAALTEPPLTSEEVLHPAISRAVEPELTVPAPPADGPVIDEGRIGELLLRLWLGRASSQGWGGDRFVTWQADGLDCIRVDLVGDDDQETGEMSVAARTWAGLLPTTRSVEETTIDGRQAIRISACH
ncbi:MAG: hypothetical protein ACR2QO_14475 [Acidimicrobiales bacterium]